MEGITPKSTDLKHQWPLPMPVFVNCLVSKARYCAECMNMKNLFRKFGLSTHAYIPGGSRSWITALPEEYHNDPHVVVVMAKLGTMTKVACTPDGWHLGIIDTERGVRGLQVLNSDGDYMCHQTIMEQNHGVKMVDPAYIGPFSDIPDHVLHNDLAPLVFLHDRMGEPFLNLKQYLWSATKATDYDRLN